MMDQKKTKYAYTLQQPNILILIYKMKNILKVVVLMLREWYYVAKCNLGVVKLKPILPAVLLICASNLGNGHL